VNKKPKKLIKLRKLKKKLKISNHKKTDQFGFISLKQKKKPNQTQTKTTIAKSKKIEPTSLKRFFFKITEPNQNQFRFDFSFFLKNQFNYFFNKN